MWDINDYTDYDRNILRKVTKEQWDGLDDLFKKYFKVFVSDADELDISWLYFLHAGYLENDSIQITEHINKMQDMINDMKKNIMNNYIGGVLCNTSDIAMHAFAVDCIYRYRLNNVTPEGADDNLYKYATKEPPNA